MGVCLLCDESISRKASDSVSCAKCNGLAHLNCLNINISKQSFEGLKRGTSVFVCKICNAKSAGSGTSTRKGSTSSLPENSTNQSTDNSRLPTDISPAVINAIREAVAQGQELAITKSTEMITEMFNVFQQKQLEFNESLNNTITEMKSSISDNSSRIDQLEFKSEKQDDEVVRARNETAKLKEKVVSLEETINRNEQALLSSSLEIHGLPFSENENLRTIFESLTNHLNVDCNNRDLVNIYRIKKQPFPSNPQLPPIVVAKLSNQKLRDEIIVKRKKCANFTASTLGIAVNNNSTIFIRETLTHANRLIYSATLKLRRDGKLKFLWLSEGKIFGKKEDGAPRVHLHNMEALSKLQ